MPCPGHSGVGLGWEHGSTPSQCSLGVQGSPRWALLTLHLFILLTFWRVFILIIPDHQQLGQTGHFGHLRDDPEEALHAVVGEDDGSEALGLRWDQRQEERVAHTSPLLQEDRRTRVREGDAAGWRLCPTPARAQPFLQVSPPYRRTSLRRTQVHELRRCFYRMDLKHTSTSISSPNH